MKLYYLVKEIGKVENKILTNYETCCKENLNGVFAGILKPGKIGPIQKWRVHFQGEPINNCPYCGEKIEFIEN